MHSGAKRIHNFIYLASQSPRRQALLTQLGVRFELLLPNNTPRALAEAEALEAVRPGEAPLAYVKRVTLLKLHAAQARLRERNLPAAPILCADTTVALGRTIYGKPLHAADARRMLGELAGASHRVLTAVALAPAHKPGNPPGAPPCVCSQSTVRFAALSAAQIRAYVATGEPLGKAGAYAVQGRAAAFIAHLSGSYSGIMGLPLHETAQLLKDARVSLQK
ncbi:MAG: Maf family protein [Burkholderiales bacterium]